MRRRFPPLTLFLLFPSVLLGAEPVDFDAQVRPILSENCFPCHGPDAEARQADLRLDLPDDFYADRDGIRVVTPGKPGESELYRRVSSGDEFERMPPADSGLKLTESERELLRRWIDEGGQWEGHWAYQELKRPPVPATDSDWPRNEIDRFILARLEKAGMAPSPEADRVTLLRRVTLDLTGLPPTPTEVDAFLNDHSDNAYEKVVDRLLDSPRYGERMAWEWLAAARYADTDGFQGDPTRTMWPWRDWLIGALNDDMPFDQFTIEMLAGDLLPDAAPEQVIATGFNRNHMYNGEGGRIAEETRVENVFDRAETTATVWLGLTATCARCHDHKYDPITQREYYQLYAFFNNTSESGSRGGGKAPPVMSYLSPEKRKLRADLDRRIAAIQKKMDEPMPEDDRLQKEWEKATAARLARFAKSEGELEIGAWHVLGPFPAPDGAKSFDFDFGPEKGVDLERTYDDGKLAWTVRNEFTDGKVHPLADDVGATYLYRTLVSPQPRTVDLSLGSDDGIKLWLNGKELLANNAFRAAAADQERVQLPLIAGRNELLLKIVNQGGPAGFYFQKTGESIAGVPPEIAEILSTGPDARSEKQRLALRRHYREQNSEPWRKLKSQRARLERERASIAKSAVPVMVMDSLPEDKRRTTAILKRGIYNKPRDETVTAGTPAFLPPLPADAPRNRLTLARWLVDPEHPLTARVIVNRYWQTLLGAGLVRTSEDFGRQGKRPSHPDLLDWLAREFIDSGWNVKALHKLIVMSATYRQSSKQTDELREADPDNRLLARSTRARRPSWMLRDQALAVSGLLVNRLGGPPVKPYQPEGIWAEATFGKIRYRPDDGDDLYRRSLYVFWRRIVGPTMFFDSGKRQTCEVKPTLTNTPLHALTTLNETAYVEASRAMAGRVIREGGATLEERLTYAFRLATARRPEASELSLLAHRLKAAREEFAEHPQRAEQLLSVGASPRAAGLPAAEQAAYATVCSLLLNLDEVLTRE